MDPIRRSGYLHVETVLEGAIRRLGALQVEVGELRDLLESMQPNPPPWVTTATMATADFEVDWDIIECPIGNEGLTAYPSGGGYVAKQPVWPQAYEEWGQLNPEVWMDEL